MAIEQKSPVNRRAPSLIPLISSDKNSSDTKVAVQVESSRKGRFKEQEQEQVVVPQLRALRPRQKLHNMDQHQNQHQHPQIHRRFDNSSKPPHQFKSITSMFQKIRLPNNLPMDLVMAGIVWYLVGVLAIVTTKIILTMEEAYAVPPLVLTLQQLVLGSTLVRIYLGVTKGVQPLPKDDRGSSSNCRSGTHRLRVIC
jgi:hypothetical protein